MAAKKFLRTGSGSELFDEVAGVQSSAGAANAGDIVSLDDTGKLDTTMMPTGVAADTTTVNTSEILAAGDLVNLWNDSGTIKARKADATTTGKEANGFVLSGYASGVPAVIYHDGTNAQATGMTVGRQWLSTTAGKSTVTRPTGSGNVQQIVGFASTTTSMTFEPGVATIKVA